MKNSKKINIMTHVIAGYRSLAETESLIDVMADCGVQYIEIQFPFSDPLGDGPVITAANKGAIDNGMTVKKSFSFFEKIAKKLSDKFSKLQTSSPRLIIMTYANIAFKMGFEKFVARAKEVGASALIIPDLPFYNETGSLNIHNERNDDDLFTFFEASKHYNLPVIPVISPNTSNERMQHIVTLISHTNAKTTSDTMVYCTRRTGITGTHATKPVIANDTQHYYKQVKRIFGIPLAAGFGISSVQQIKLLPPEVDIAVIGSHIITLYRDTPVNSKQGLEKVSQFLQSIIS